MYRILMDGMDIYGHNAEMSVLNPSLDIELNSAGSLEFTLPVENTSWATPQVFTNEVEVIEDGEVIFFGRPLQITRDWNNQKKVVCEGALAYFNDTIQRTHEIKLSSHTTLEAFFRRLITVHNSQVDDQQGSGISHKHFEVGIVDIENKNKYVYRMTDYQTTFECLQQMCLDTDGGYFILRKEYDEYSNATRYIDWVSEMPYGADQPVQFGVNLLDISQDLNGADICTVLIPIGGDNINLSGYQTVNPDAAGNIYKGVGHLQPSDEIYYKPAMDVYGRVVQQKSWGDYTDQGNLWMKAAEWLKRKNEYIPTIEVSAADLHYIDKYKDQGTPMYSVFKLGMAVEVISAPHGITGTVQNPWDEEPTVLIIHKMSLDLDSATKKITIGTPPKKELTDILAPSAGGSSTRGSGGNSSGESSVVHTEEKLISVKSIMVKASGESDYSCAIQNKVAYIDLDAVEGKVKDIEVDGVSVLDPDTGIANIQSAVEDVLVDGQSVVNEDKEAEISIPVKGVTYNGIDVVNPDTGIAEINQSLSVGQLQDVDWYERDYGETDPEIRTVTVTEPGIYFAVFSLLEVNARVDFPEHLPYYFDVTVSGGTVLYQSYMSMNDTLSPDLVNGKIVVFSNSSTSTVTFKGTNYTFYLINTPEVGVDKPATYGWYEYDSSLKRFVLSEDVYAVQKNYYVKYGYGNFVRIDNVQPGVDTPAANLWYEYDENTLHRMIISKDEYAIEYKSYYLPSEVTDKAKTSKTRHVFKLKDVDPAYITFIGNTSGSYHSRTFLESVVPNNNDVYLVIAACKGAVNDTNGDEYFNSVDNYQGIDLDAIFSPNSVINRKSIIHIGDGTYRKEYPSGSTTIFNSSNIKLEELISPYSDEWSVDENETYLLIDTGANIHANVHNPNVNDINNVYAFRISQPIGVIDVQHNTQSLVNPDGVAEIGDVAYKSDVSDMQTYLQTNFQAGVDSVYNACVSKGSTPVSHSLTDVVNGILAIPTGGGGGGVTITSKAQEIYMPKANITSNINATVTVTATAGGS